MKTKEQAIKTAQRDAVYYSNFHTTKECKKALSKALTAPAMGNALVYERAFAAKLIDLGY